MYKTKNKICFLIVLMAALSFTACKKWIDAPAPMQVDQDKLFSNEQGFTDALNAVYLQMGSRNLYGRDLSFGLLSVMGRSYDTTITPAIGNLYYQGIQYNFQDAAVKEVTTAMWNELYFSIGNLNNLLANIDTKKNVFAGDNYALTKAEALGLRAFLHFELARLFVPSPAAAGLTAPAIPYVTKLVPYATAPVTTGAFIDSCIADLFAAKSLFNNAEAATTSRFNSYAVKGLLARIYLYKGDLANAKTYADELINSNRFPLAINNTDLLYLKEQLFSLYSYGGNSTTYYKSVLNTTPALGFTTRNQTALFVTGSGSINDWRKLFVDPANNALFGNVISPRKFYALSNHPNTLPNVIPMLRLTEMYYIATECAIANNDLTKATALLDTVRVHRNVPKYVLAALPVDSLNAELGREYQKEFLGEAQAYYYFKRKNIPFASLPFTRVPVVANASYVFVKPE
jgi:hypothetical protein